ncbi:unnamed protein product [Ambrosiozyma monospora]|uniref:Unnamed protein product n=1 Tax=Ambrosiozyma monospora TaxID=43982 RepID=A0ACB5TFX8_AMBMO|nr:unnamed protein product [Ambrosiozyma monospora]
MIDLKSLTDNTSLISHAEKLIFTSFKFFKSFTLDILGSSVVATFSFSNLEGNLMGELIKVSISKLRDFKVSGIMLKNETSMEHPSKHKYSNECKSWKCTLERQLYRAPGSNSNLRFFRYVVLFINLILFEFSE